MLKIGMEICRDVTSLRCPSGYLKLMNVYSHLSGSDFPINI